MIDIVNREDGFAAECGWTQDADAILDDPVWPEIDLEAKPPAPRADRANP